MDGEGWGQAPVEAHVEAAPAESEADFLARRDAEIMAWQAAKPVAAEAVERERELRARVTATLFPTPRKGTQRYDLGGGYKVKLVHGTTYNLGNKDMVDPATNEPIPIKKQVEDLQQAIAELGNEGPMLAERLIKWKPELSASEYEKLNVEFDIEAKAKALIDAILTTKPASPQLELEEPKPAK